MNQQLTIDGSNWKVCIAPMMDWTDESKKALKIKALE